MFFEPQHSLSENYFQLYEDKNLNFPLHIHRSFEYCEQVSGVTEIHIGDKKYVLKEGEAMLVFPLQPHSYTSLETGRVRMCIFSPDMVATFVKKTEGRIPADNTFFCSLPENMPRENLFHRKSVAYFICGQFDRGREYVKSPNQNESRVLVPLLLFAEKNFNNKCLLRDVAEEIGYDYAYVSKLFKRKVGISFRQYVNSLRVAKSKDLLLRSAKSIEEVGADSGFASLRAFDREFRHETKMSPSEYRCARNVATKRQEKEEKCPAK
ncbi:MAG: helix-turn-helix transcriptional regulator [Clostridia bacterium]|nr:helix-turn-helix transcriptional regulator [Clostridia bacterium]